MKLLILPDPGRSTNTVRPEASIFVSLKQRGHDVTIMVDDDGCYLDEYRAAGINVISSSSKTKLNLSVIKAVNRYIKAHDIDLVYATKSRTIPNAIAGCLGTKAKMVAYRGTTGGLYRSDLSNYLSILHPRVNGVICVSKAVEAHVRNQVFKKNIPIETIYKGHDLAWYKDEQLDIKSLGSDESQFNILCVGSTRPHKGTFVVLDAMTKLKHLNQLKLILVGDGLEGNEFNRYIADRGLTDRVIKTGFRRDVPAIAKACDITILPSDREGLPRIVLESLAVGTPVITSANDGALEIISDGENGLVFPVRDSDGLAQQLERVATDKALLEHLTQRANKVICTNFSHQTTVEEYERYFQALISS